MRIRSILSAFSVSLMIFSHNALAEPTLSVHGARPTLVENFTKRTVWRRGQLDASAPTKPLNDKSFSWSAGYIWNHPEVSATPQKWQEKPSGAAFPAWTSNGNANTDPNGDMIRKLGDNRSPLKWTGTLDFTVNKMPADLVPTIGPEDSKDYLGASIASFPYAQRYGVFAMVAKLPKGRGVWPAFWLMPADKSWPPELDIMEVIGKEPSTLYTTLHIKTPQGDSAKAFGTKTNLDLSKEFHEYAVDWGPKEIKWYFDRKQVFVQPTPDSFHQPFYIIANIAVGKPQNWGGAPDDSTILPATMKVKSIHAWQRPEYEAK